MPAKKKSCFQITSVTQAQVAANSATDDTESLDDPDESRTEDVSSEIFDMSRTEVCDRSSSEETLNNVGYSEGQTPQNGGVGPRNLGNHQGTQASGTQTAQVTSSSSATTITSCSSRFRVIKLDHGTGEPFRRGRWTCTEYYEKDPEGSVMSRTVDSIWHTNVTEPRADRDSGLGTTVGSVMASDVNSDGSGFTGPPHNLEPHSFNVALGSGSPESFSNKPVPPSAQHSLQSARSRGRTPGCPSSEISQHPSFSSSAAAALSTPDYYAPTAKPAGSDINQSAWLRPAQHAHYSHPASPWGEPFRRTCRQSGVVPSSHPGHRRGAGSGYSRNVWTPWRCSFRERTSVICPKYGAASCVGAVEQHCPYALHSAAAAGGTVPGLRSNAWFIDNSAKHSELARSTGDARCRITQYLRTQPGIPGSRNGTAAGIGAGIFSQMDESRRMSDVSAQVHGKDMVKTLITEGLQLPSPSVNSLFGIPIPIDGEDDRWGATGGLNDLRGLTAWTLRLGSHSHGRPGNVKGF